MYTANPAILVADVGEVPRKCLRDVIEVLPSLLAIYLPNTHEIRKLNTSGSFVSLILGETCKTIVH